MRERERESCGWCRLLGEDKEGMQTRHTSKSCHTWGSKESAHKLSEQQTYIIILETKILEVGAYVGWFCQL